MLIYNVLLFLHIAAAMVWVGSGFLAHVLFFRAERSNDPAALLGVLRDLGALGNIVFVPASLATFLLGVALAFAGGWSFSDLWIILGLAGFIATFVTGAFFLKPYGDEIAEMMRRDGGMSREAAQKARQLVAIGRIEYVVLLLVVGVMVLKPTVSDLGVLIAMAAVLVAGIVVFLTQAHLAAKAAAARG
jgi:uncharacterized membrane protein